MRQNVHCWFMACDRKSAALQRSLGGSISWYSTVATVSRCKFHINAKHYFKNARGMKIMSLPTPLMLKGAPGSPYTRKMLAVLRYRHIPYVFLQGNEPERRGLPRPKVQLLPTFYLPSGTGKVEAVVDSTPLIRRFEEAFPDRKIVPTDPVVECLDYLLEDFADEWLTKAMFHYR